MRQQKIERRRRRKRKNLDIVAVLSVDTPTPTPTPTPTTATAREGVVVASGVSSCIGVSIESSIIQIWEFK